MDNFLLNLSISFLIFKFSKATGLNVGLFQEVQNDHHTNYAGMIRFQDVFLIVLVALLSQDNYLIEAPKYDIISRIEVTEQQLRSKSECEIQTFIRYLNDKGRFCNTLK